MKLSEISKKIEEFLSNLYAKWGIFLTKYHIWIFTSCFLFLGACMYGFITIEPIDDVAVDWTPRNSRILDDYDTFKKYYGNMGRAVTIYAEVKNLS